jgi:hypothetical protein
VGTGYAIRRPHADFKNQSLASSEVACRLRGVGRRRWCWLLVCVGSMKISPLPVELAGRGESVPRSFLKVALSLTCIEVVPRKVDAHMAPTRLRMQSPCFLACIPGRFQGGVDGDPYPQGITTRHCPAFMRVTRFRGSTGPCCGAISLSCLKHVLLATMAIPNLRPELGAPSEEDTCRGFQKVSGMLRRRLKV